MIRNVLPVRDRVVVLSGLGFATALSWGMWYLARDPTASCMVNMNPWSAADLSALFAMWAVMMIAMMIPSALADDPGVCRREPHAPGPIVALCAHRGFRGRVPGGMDWL